MLRPRRRPRLASLVRLLGADLLAVACNAREVRRESSASLTSVDLPRPAGPASAPSATPFPTEPALSCASLRDVGVSDVVRVDGGTLFCADATAGHTAVDIADAAHPRVLSIVPFVGTPKRHTVVEAFGVQGTTLRVLDSVDTDGVPAQLAASAAGLAAVTTSDDHATVAWLDLSMERPGSIFLRQSVRLPGGVATWERGEGRVVDADEGQRVRIVTCATKSCSPSDPATLQIVDFAAEAPARRITSLRLTERGGLPTTRFADGVLYVTETAANGGEFTTLRRNVTVTLPAPRATASPDGSSTLPKPV